MWWHLSRGVETFLGGRLGVFEELHAGQGGVNYWEGKSKRQGEQRQQRSRADYFFHSLPFLLHLFALLEFTWLKLKWGGRRNARTQFSALADQKKKKKQKKNRNKNKQTLP